MEYNKEETEFEKMQSNLKRAREVYFKYFPSQRMALTKSNSKEEGHDVDENSVPTTTSKENKEGEDSQNWY